MQQPGVGGDVAKSDQLKTKTKGSIKKSDVMNISLLSSNLKIMHSKTGF